MRKILGSFTFWGLLIGIFEIYMHQIGQDSFSIVLIQLNPILSVCNKYEAVSTIINSGFQIRCNTVAGNISIYWYIGTLVTFILYGAVIDLVKAKIKRAK